MPKDIKDERLSLVVEFDSGPLPGKLRHTFPVQVRRDGSGRHRPRKAGFAEKGIPTIAKPEDHTIKMVDIHTQFRPGMCIRASPAQNLCRRPINSIVFWFSQKPTVFRRHFCGAIKGCAKQLDSMKNGPASAICVVRFFTSPKAEQESQ